MYKQHYSTHWCSIIGAILGHVFAIFWLFLLLFCFCQGEIIQIVTKNTFRAIRPCDILLNCHTHMLADSTTPLQFYCGNQGTAVDLWSCFSSHHHTTLDSSITSIYLLWGKSLWSMERLFNFWGNIKVEEHTYKWYKLTKFQGGVSVPF